MVDSLFVAGVGWLSPDGVIVPGLCCDGIDLCSDCFFASLSNDSVLPVIFENISDSD